jgi:TPR repeat protein
MGHPAAVLFSKACNAGNSAGCANLGNYYRIGFGVAQDSEKARQYLTKSCNLGCQWGCDRLKEMQ